MRNLVLSGFLAFALVSCGTDDSPPPAGQHEDTLGKVDGSITDDIDLATPEELKSGEATPGSYLVAFRNNLTSAGMAFASYTREYQAHYMPLAQRFLSDPAVTAINYITALDLRPAQGLKTDAGFSVPSALRLAWNAKDPGSMPASVARVEFRSPEDARERLAAWQAQGVLWYAEANRVSKVSQGAASYSELAETYDVMAAKWHQQIKLVQAYQVLQQRSISVEEAPLIAVLDSGTDYEHPALKGRIFKNTGVNGAGCLNDYYGCDTTQSDRSSLGVGNVYPQGTTGPGQSCPPDISACKHGTHVAGIIAGEPQQNYGGICPVCQILSVRIVGTTKNGQGSPEAILDSSIVAGFAYISRFKKGGKTAVRVVNASFGKFQRSRTVGLLIRLLRKAGSGTLVVAAAGNEDTMKRQFPAAFEDVIAVSNIRYDNGVKHRTSSFGLWVDIAAPGSGGDTAGILSSIPGNQTESDVGTSMAAPIVAGVAGLLLAFKPEMGYDELKDRLLATADPGIYEAEDNAAYYPSTSLETFPIPLLGRGVVDAYAAMEYRIPAKAISTATTDRVSSDCGVIGATHNPGKTMILLIMPLIFMFITNRRKLLD